MTTLMDFFGDIENMSNLNLWIAVTGRFPEWLRGIPKEADLPRRTMRLDLAHRFVAPPTAGEVGERAFWIIENLDGPWNITHTWLFLESDTDAVKYKLTWG